MFTAVNWTLGKSNITALLLTHCFNLDREEGVEGQYVRIKPLFKKRNEKQISYFLSNCFEKSRAQSGNFMNLF